LVQARSRNGQDIANPHFSPRPERRTFTSRRKRGGLEVFYQCAVRAKAALECGSASYRFYDR